MRDFVPVRTLMAELRYYLARYSTREAADRNAVGR